VDVHDLEGTIRESPRYLTMDDELWFHGLIDDKLQGATFGVNLDIEMRRPDETPVAASLWRLLQLGIYDLADNEGKWPGSTRSQHFTASVAHRLWFLFRTEQKAVSRSHWGRTPTY
jgi:hypothetical protein